MIPHSFETEQDTFRRMVENYHLEPLPDWASDKAREGKIVPMQQLYTKEGRARGNAMVVRIAYVCVKDGVPNPVYEIVTDANNWGKYTHSELTSCFELGVYVLKDFVNPKSKEQWDVSQRPTEGRDRAARTHDAGCDYLGSGGPDHP